ncbi:MAG: hypothetical protein ABI723_03215 [Bacteroidia bacterium]
MKKSQQQFTNAQLAVLPLFNEKLTDDEINELKKIISKILYKRAVNAANEAWDKNKWTKKDEERILKTHMRTPYKKK